MCYKVKCSKCGLFTWAGCGRHKDRVLAQIPMDQRCSCDKLPQNTNNPKPQKPVKSLLSFMNDNKYQPQKSEMYNLLRAAVQETTKKMLQSAENTEEKKSNTMAKHPWPDYDEKESNFFKKNPEISAIKNVMISENKQHPLYDLQSWEQEKWSITLAELILRSKFVKCAETLLEAITKVNEFENHCYAQMKKRNHFQNDYGLLYFLGFSLARSRLNMLFLEQMENKSHLTVIIPMYNAHVTMMKQDFVRRKVSELQWLYKNISHKLMDWNVIFVDDGCPKESGKKALEMIASDAFCDRNCPCTKNKITVQFLEKGFEEINKFKKDNILQSIFKKKSTKGGAVQYGMYKALEYKAESNEKEHFICYTESDLSVNIAQCGNLLADMTINDIKKERVAVIADRNKSNNRIVIGNTRKAVVIRLRHTIWGGLIPAFKTLNATDCGLIIFKRACIEKILPKLRLYEGMWEMEILLKTYNAYSDVDETKEEKYNNYKECIYPTGVVCLENTVNTVNTVSDEKQMDTFTNAYGWKQYNFIKEIIKMHNNGDLNQEWSEFVESNLEWKDYFKICQVAFCSKYNMGTWDPTVDDLKRIIEKEEYPPNAPVFIQNMKQNQ